MSKIREILNDDESILVFDVDGVLAVMEWGEYNHYGEDDETWTKMYEENSNFYTEDFVCKRMQEFIKSKDANKIFVITKAFCENEVEDKKNFVNKYYGIPKEHVYSVQSNIQKTDVLIGIKEKYPDLPGHKLVMIDDTVEILTNIMERTGFSTAHISTFLD
ncbi:MAG: hypothetical protein IJ220_03920 [Clostridia bacterium]|nr:hypothetical protein [Clostridia bacterium]